MVVTCLMLNKNQSELKQVKGIGFGDGGVRVKLFLLLRNSSDVLNVLM